MEYYADFCSAKQAFQCINPVEWDCMYWNSHNSIEAQASMHIDTSAFSEDLSCVYPKRTELLFTFLQKYLEI
jgi:hypothetical protein